jgi:hypothetical protein
MNAPKAPKNPSCRKNIACASPFDLNNYILKPQDKLVRINEQKTLDMKLTKTKVNKQLGQGGIFMYKKSK